MPTRVWKIINFSFNTRHSYLIIPRTNRHTWMRGREGREKRGEGRGVRSGGRGVRSGGRGVKSGGRGVRSGRREGVCGVPCVARTMQ